MRSLMIVSSYGVIMWANQAFYLREGGGGGGTPRKSHAPARFRTSPAIFRSFPHLCFLKFYDFRRIDCV